jgi:hypothetical protein
MRRFALSATACFCVCLAFGARTACAESDASDGQGPKSTFSLHPLGTALLNVAPGSNFFQFTYEYHPGPGRLSWAWDPSVLFIDRSEKDNPQSFSLWVLPIVAPRWYFRTDAQGWFGGAKLGYIHYLSRNDERPPAYSIRTRYRERSELAYGAGEYGFKRDWKKVSFYASGQLGVTLGMDFNEYTEADQPTEHSFGATGTPFGQINCGLGYRF